MSTHLICGRDEDSIATLNSMTDIDECVGDPCLNSGNCSNTPGSYKCECIKGFEGKNCEKGMYLC